MVAPTEYILGTIELIAILLVRSNFIKGFFVEQN